MVEIAIDGPDPTSPPGRNLQYPLKFCAARGVPKGSSLAHAGLQIGERPPIGRSPRTSFPAQEFQRHVGVLACQLVRSGKTDPIHLQNRTMAPDGISDRGQMGSQFAATRRQQAIVLVFLSDRMEGAASNLVKLAAGGHQQRICAGNGLNHAKRIPADPRQQEQMSADLKRTPGPRRRRLRNQMFRRENAHRSRWFSGSSQ